MSEAEIEPFLATEKATISPCSTRYRVIPKRCPTRAGRLQRHPIGPRICDGTDVARVAAHSLPSRRDPRVRIRLATPLSLAHPLPLSADLFHVGDDQGPFRIIDRCNAEPHAMDLAARTVVHPVVFFGTGTGTPGIFTLSEPRWMRLVK